MAILFHQEVIYIVQHSFHDRRGHIHVNGGIITEIFTMWRGVTARAISTTCNN